MGNHWPIAVAGAIIALAAFLGLWQHEQAATAATAASAARSAAPATTPTAAPATPDTPATPAAPATPTPRALPAAPAPTTPTTPAAAPVVNPAAAVPTAPAVTPPPAVIPAPVTPTAPAVMPGGPAAVAQEHAALAAANDPAKRAGRTKTLDELRQALQAKLGVAPMDLAAGGFAANVEGVRVEVQPSPNWSISLYNINPKQPTAETESFKKSLEVVTGTLALDMTQKAYESPNGKSYLRTTSKIGQVSMVRDPAMNNSCVIRPIQALIPTAPKGDAAGNEQPRIVRPDKAPKVPATPVAPPRPPATDNNF